MRYYINISDGYINSISTVNLDGEGNATEKQYAEIKTMLTNKPKATGGYDYKLTADLEWELVELPQVEEQPTAYTAEQLAEMTNAELSTILADMGISGIEDKQEMINKILSFNEPTEEDYKQALTELGVLE